MSRNAGDEGRKLVTEACLGRGRSSFGT